VIKERSVHRLHYRVADDHERDIGAFIHQPLHQLCRLQGIGRRLDAVMQRVPVGELLLHGRENGRIFIHCENHGVRHALTLGAATAQARYGQHHPPVKAAPTCSPGQLRHPPSPNGAPARCPGA
jgi:hypothetical protein